MTPSVEDDNEEAEGEETTLYFDAEEGTFRTESGHEITFDVDEEGEEEEEDEEAEEEEDGEGSRTPQPAASSMRPTQTITSTSSTSPDVSRNVSGATPRRRGLLRRFSSATQRRVSQLHFFES